MQNGWFTLRCDPAKGHAKVYAQEKWAVAKHMGRTEKSKTLQILEHDEGWIPGQTPTRTFLALRAWMCWRAKRKGFVEARVARRRWHASEVDRLRGDIADLAVPDGGTGSPVADALIREWYPSVLGASS